MEVLSLVSADSPLPVVQVVTRSLCPHGAFPLCVHVKREREL